MPDDLSRRLFDVLRLEINYDRSTNLATCRVTLSGDTVRAVAQASHEVVTLPFGQAGPPPRHKGGENGYTQ